MDRYSGLAQVQELLPRWRTYGAYLVENGASTVLQDIGTAEDSGGDRPSGIGGRMETYIAQEIFPAWITTEAVVMLSGLSAPVRLDLASTPLADDALPYLERFVKLEFLGLRHTQVSQAGRERLRRALVNAGW